MIPRLKPGLWQRRNRRTEEDNENSVMIVYYDSEIETWALAKTK
jgi:hypothetical protein